MYTAHLVFALLAAIKLTWPAVVIALVKVYVNTVMPYYTRAITHVQNVRDTYGHMQNMLFKIVEL